MIRLSTTIPWQCYDPECNSQLKVRNNIANVRIMNLIKNDDDLKQFCSALPGCLPVTFGFRPNGRSSYCSL